MLQVLVRPGLREEQSWGMLRIEPSATLRRRRDGRRRPLLHHMASRKLVPPKLVPPLGRAGGPRVRGGRLLLVVSAARGLSAALREVQRALHPVPPVPPHVA